MSKSVGMIEMSSIAIAHVAQDAMLKAANVETARCAHDLLGKIHRDNWRRCRRS